MKILVSGYQSKRRGAYIAAHKALRAQEFMQCLTPKKNCSVCGISLRGKAEP